MRKRSRSVRPWAVALLRRLLHGPDHRTLRAEREELLRRRERRTEAAR
jgi:hypothetical protein